MRRKPGNCAGTERRAAIEVYDVWRCTRRGTNPEKVVFEAVEADQPDWAMVAFLG